MQTKRLSRGRGNFVLTKTKLSVTTEITLVLGVGIEPTRRLRAGNFKSPAATNYATRALRCGRELNPRIRVLQTPVLPLHHRTLIIIQKSVNFLSVFLARIHFKIKQGNSS